MTLSRLLADRLFELHDCEVVVSGMSNWKKDRPLIGRVTGWSFDKERDDEPLVELRYGSDLPEGWADQTDTVGLSHVQLVSQPSAIAICQRY